MIKKLIPLILIILTSTASYADTEEKSLISVNGEATIYTEPDEVAINMTVEVNDKDLKEAQSKNDEITNKVLRIAKNKLRIEDKYIQTNYINVSPVYNYNMCGQQRCATPQLTHFSTKKGISIRLKDASQLQGLIEDSVEAGVTRIDSVSFISSKEENLQKQAYAKAAKDARSNAENIASALGVSVGSPHRINVSYSRPKVQSGGIVAMALKTENSNNETISLGQIIIEANVSVDFEIER